MIFTKNKVMGSGFWDTAFAITLALTVAVVYVNMLWIAWSHATDDITMICYILMPVLLAFRRLRRSGGGFTLRLPRMLRRCRCLRNLIRRN